MRVMVVFVLSLLAFDVAAFPRAALERVDLETAAIQLQIANHAAQSDQKRDRLVAALLLKYLPEKLVTAEIAARQKKLFADATQATNDDALILLWRLGASEDKTEQMAIAQKMTEVSPDWVMGWLASLPSSYSEDQLAYAESLLARAAIAPDYNGRSGELMRHVSRLAVGAGIAPPTASIRKATQLPSGADAADLGIYLGLTIEVVHLQTWMHSTPQPWCPTSPPDKSAPSCSSVLQRLSVESTELASLALSHAVSNLRATNDDERAQILTLVSALNWMTDNVNRRHSSHLQDFLEVWKMDGMTEIGAYRALMGRWGIPLTPPSDYRSNWVKVAQQKARDHERGDH